MYKRDVVVVAEQGNDLVSFAHAHQPGINEHTGQLVANGLVYQDRRDC